MVKRTITITTFLLILTMAVSLIIVLNRSSFAADDDIASGTSGTCSWVIDSDGVLTIRPTNGVSGVLESNSSFYSPWFSNNSHINKIVIQEGVKANEESSYLFAHLDNCKEMDLYNLDTSNVTTMWSMFAFCKNLKTLDLSSFDTSNVTTMWNMFSNCSNLENIDLASFNTSKVTDMSGMFDECSKLEYLDLSNFNTSKITRMDRMFDGCESLKSIDLSSFDTRNVKNMCEMFFWCKSLKSIDLSSFDTSNVTDMYRMFHGCENLTNIDVSNFDTSKVMNMSYMFSGCRKLTNIDVSNFDTSKVINMSYMFFDCNSLPTIDVSNFNTSQVTDMSYMFSGCRKLTNIDVTSFDTSNVTVMHRMFEGCVNLANIDVSNFDTSKVMNMSDMFSGCMKLTNIDVTSFNTSNVTNMCYMFAACKELSEIDVSSFNTGEVTKMRGMFAFCEKIKIADVSGFDTNNVTDMSEMFAGCKELSKIDASNFDTSKVNYMPNMFLDCNKLETIYLGDKFSFKGANIENIYEQAVLPYGGFEGKWICEDKEIGPYTPEELRENYDGTTMAGKWVRYKDERNYHVKYFFDGKEDESLEEIINAKIDDEISIKPQSALKHEEKNYTLVSSNHTINVSANDEDNVIEVYYETDVLNHAIETDVADGDGIPDKYQIKISYKVENGSWNDGTSAIKTKVVTLYDENGNLSEQGIGKTTVPSVGEKPDEGYTQGFWNKEIPKDVSSKDNGSEFIYSYEKIVKADVAELGGKGSNPKTNDVIQNYLLAGVGGVLVLALVSRIRKRYSRKARRIQF